MPAPITPKTSYDEMQQVTLPPITRRGCFKGCLTFIVAIVLIYAVRAGVALAVAAVNYNKWTAQGITSYSVTVKYGSLVGAHNTGRETVKNGALVRSNAGYTEPAIDRLFEAAKSCALIFTCRVDFDPQYGYPDKYVEFDFEFGDVTEITDLTPEPK